MRKIIIPGIIFYLALVYLHWGLFYADFRYDMPLTGDASYDASERWNDCSQALLFAIIPPGWLIGPFVSGFYNHGWVKPCQVEPR